MAQRPFKTYDEWVLWRDRVLQEFADDNARRRREAEERNEPPGEPIVPTGLVAAWLRQPPGGGSGGMA